MENLNITRIFEDAYDKILKVDNYIANQINVDNLVYEWLDDVDNRPRWTVAMKAKDLYIHNFSLWYKRKYHQTFCITPTDFKSALRRFNHIKVHMTNRSNVLYFTTLV